MFEWATHHQNDGGDWWCLFLSFNLGGLRHFISLFLMLAVITYLSVLLYFYLFVPSNIQFFTITFSTCLFVNFFLYQLLLHFYYRLCVCCKQLNNHTWVQRGIDLHPNRPSMSTVNIELYVINLYQMQLVELIE